MQCVFGMCRKLRKVRNIWCTFHFHNKKIQQWDYVVIEINLTTLGRAKTSQIYGHFKCCMVRNVAYLFFSLVHIISCNEDQIFPTHLLMEITI